METEDEATEERFCCLATVETAFENKGEVRAMPGTSEYGSRRTGVEETGRSKENNQKMKVRK